MQGIWQINWSGVPKYTIEFNNDGTFFQKAGNHQGRWSLKFGLLTIEYNDELVKIMAIVNPEFSEFNGNRYWYYDDQPRNIKGKSLSKMTRTGKKY